MEHRTQPRIRVNQRWHSQLRIDRLATRATQHTPHLPHLSCQRRQPSDKLTGDNDIRTVRSRVFGTEEIDVYEMAIGLLRVHEPSGHFLPCFEMGGFPRHGVKPCCTPGKFVRAAYLTQHR